MQPRTVAALYVDPRGPYPNIPGVECWDESRDARGYGGPHPVVAHPPCARWCKLAKFVEARHGYRVGDDGGVFEAALATVRRFGGVLEHPAQSLAWSRFGLTKPPPTGWLRTFDGEWVCSVAQSAYGHPARKQTWLLLVGADEPPQHTRWARPAGERTVTHLAQRHTGNFNDTGRGHEARMSKSETHLTPAPFAHFLVNMARGCSVPGNCAVSRNAG